MLQVESRSKIVCGFRSRPPAGRGAGALVLQATAADQGFKAPAQTQLRPFKHEA